MLAHVTLLYMLLQVPDDSCVIVLYSADVLSLITPHAADVSCLIILHGSFKIQYRTDSSCLHIAVAP